MPARIGPRFGAQVGALGSLRPLRPFRPFRTAVPNAAGWSALAGAAVTSGLLSASAGAWAGVGRAGRVALGAAGSLAPPLAALVADRRRWASQDSMFGWDASPAEVYEVVEDLRARGVFAECREEPGGFSEAPADAPGPRIVALPPTAALVYRNSDSDVVHRVLAANGVELPPRRGDRSGPRH